MFKLCYHMGEPTVKSRPVVVWRGCLTRYIGCPVSLCFRSIMRKYLCACLMEMARVLSHDDTIPSSTKTTIKTEIRKLYTLICMLLEEKNG